MYVLLIAQNALITVDIIGFALQSRLRSDLTAIVWMLNAG